MNDLQHNKDQMDPACLLNPLATSDCDSNSISTISNRANDIAESTQDQQLPSVGSSSIETPSEVVNGSRRVIVAGGQTESLVSQGASRAPQARAHNPQRKRRHVGSPSSLNSILSQPSIGPTNKRSRATINGGKFSLPLEGLLPQDASVRIILMRLGSEPPKMKALPSRLQQIAFRYSQTPIALLRVLGDPLFGAVQTSAQWEQERRTGELTTDCLIAFIPRNQNEDISIILSIGHQKGLEIINLLLEDESRFVQPTIERSHIGGGNKLPPEKSRFPNF